jgi:ferredoxin
MTLYRVCIDRSLCSGFGACAAEFPDLFSLDGSGLATVAATTADERVLDAADACPMGAIVVEEAKAA